MKVHVLKQEQDLPVSLADAWAFFSRPGNLASMTPPDEGFEVTYASGADRMGMSELRVHEGQIITYRAKVMPLVWMTWVTEIRGVTEGREFVDEQLAGPYRLWHHRHGFEEIEGGVRVTDVVHYVMPMGFIGEIARLWFVKEKLRRVFEFRRRVLEERFGRM